MAAPLGQEPPSGRQKGGEGKTEEKEQNTNGNRAQPPAWRGKQHHEGGQQDDHRLRPPHRRIPPRPNPHREGGPGTPGEREGWQIIYSPIPSIGLYFHM